MSNKEKAKLVLVVDVSGSMSSLSRQASDGINKLIREQKETPGYCSLELYEFSDDVKLVYSGDIKDYKETYRLKPTNSTALWDAMGISLEKEVNKITKTGKSLRPAVKLFTLVTDGGENSSKTWYDGVNSPAATLSRGFTTSGFSSPQYKEARKSVVPLIEKAKAQGWDFTFLCNDPTVKQMGQSVGIEQTLQYDTNAIEAVYSTTSSKMSRMRGQSMRGEKVVNLYSANEISMMGAK